MNAEKTPLDNASWIWCSDDVQRPNQHGLFRRVIDLPDQFRRVVVNACADTHYWLFVNGKRVGFGPGRYNRNLPRYDTFDVTGLVQPGKNVIGFKVYSMGPHELCVNFMPVRAALIAAVQWAGGTIITDGDWHAIEEKAYAQDTPRISPEREHLECFDARKAQVNWMQPGFDDSEWNEPYLLPDDALAPWKHTVPRLVRPLTLVPRMPLRVLEHGTSIAGPEYKPENIEATAEAMSEAVRRPSEAVTLHYSGPFPIFFKSPESPREAAYAIFDFGENANGFLTFDVVGTPGTIVDIGYGENMDNGRVDCKVRDTRFQDRFILCEGHMEHQFMWPKHLRYLLVEVRGGRALMTGILHDVSHHPVHERGKLVCPGQPELAHIWRVGARTVQNCMQDMFINSPRRGCAGSLADLVPEAMTGYYAFGELELVKHTLGLIMSSQQEGGWISGRFPAVPEVNLPLFSVVYPLALADYVRYSGDYEFAKDVWSGLERLTDWFEQQRSEEDLLSLGAAEQRTGDRRLPHGSELPREGGASTTLNMFYFAYLRESAFLASLIGEQQESQVFTEMADRTRRAIQTHLFNQSDGVFSTGLGSEGLAEVGGWLENLLALLWEIGTTEQMDRVKQRIEESQIRRLPTWQGAEVEQRRREDAFAAGPPMTYLLPIGSPLFAYYALWSLFEIGETQLALNTIGSAYGTMIGRGATTIWSNWLGEGSRCRGGAAGPTPLLSRYLLGIEPEVPGYGRFTALPSLGTLDAARGRVPTPYGTIEAGWERTATGVAMDLLVPQNTTALAGLPAETESHQFLLDGIPAKAVEEYRRRGKYMTSELSAGHHRLEIIFES